MIIWYVMIELLAIYVCLLLLNSTPIYWHLSPKQDEEMTTAWGYTVKYRSQKLANNPL